MRCPVCWNFEEGLNLWGTFFWHNETGSISGVHFAVSRHTRCRWWRWGSHLGFLKNRLDCCVLVPASRTNWVSSVPESTGLGFWSYANDFLVAVWTAPDCKAATRPEGSPSCFASVIGAFGGVRVNSDGLVVASAGVFVIGCCCCVTPLEEEEAYGETKDDDAVERDDGGWGGGGLDSVIVWVAAGRDVAGGTGSARDCCCCCCEPSTLVALNPGTDLLCLCASNCSPHCTIHFCNHCTIWSNVNYTTKTKARYYHIQILPLQNNSVAASEPTSLEMPQPHSNHLLWVASTEVDCL